MKKSTVYALIAIFAWATLAPITKLLLQDTPSMQTLFITSFFAFLFLLPICLFGKARVYLKAYRLKDYLKMAGLGFLGTFLYSFFYYFALSIIPAQEATIVNYLWPVLLVVFSCIILKEKLTAIKIAALICSFIGVMVLSLGNISAIKSTKLLGILSAGAASISYSLFCVMNKKENYNQPITMMIMWLTTALCALVLGLFTETWVPIEGTEWIGFGWLGIVTNGIAYLIWALALQESPNSSSVSNLAFLSPFLSLCLSSLILHEALSFRALIALLFIFAGIFIQAFFGHGKKKHAVQH